MGPVLEHPGTPGRVVPKYLARPRGSDHESSAVGLLGEGAGMAVFLGIIPASHNGTADATIDASDAGFSRAKGNGSPASSSFWLIQVTRAMIRRYPDDGSRDTE